MSQNHRFMVAGFILIAATIFLHANSSYEALPSHLRLISFPMQFSDWTGTELRIPQDSLTVLGPGDFMLRQYQNTSQAKPEVNLFIAFFPSQRTGDAIHSPKNCLPGSGWYPLQSSRINLNLPGHKSFPVNRYLIAKGTERQLVFYWYWAHDRGVASEYWAKYYLVKDSIQMHRSDGSLVRVATPLAAEESSEQAQQRLLDFAGNVLPLLNQYVPR